MKAAAERRRELIDCAQQLFLSKGYEQTSINDVILATGLSKGAFYHHFKSKDDLLEAVTARFAEQSLKFVEGMQADPDVNALERLNRLLALGREWKREHLHELLPMFTTLLKRENAVLYHRIVMAAMSVLQPAIAAVVERGVEEGVFQPVDSQVASETMLSLNDSRRPVLIAALSLARTDPKAAMAHMLGRIRAEETIIDRILGLPAGSVQLGGSPEVLEEMLLTWTDSAASAD